MLISLVNLSKFFLGNRDNFFPHEQALSDQSIASASKNRTVGSIPAGKPMVDDDKSF